MMPIYTTPFVDVLSLSLFQFFFPHTDKEKLSGVVHLLISALNLCCGNLSRYTPSSSCVKQFHCHLCPLAVLSVRLNPGSQDLPFLLSFRQHHVVPGSQFSLGCPGLLWLHLDQVPQGLLGYMSCMSTSRLALYHYKMDKMKQAAKNSEKQTISSFWQFYRSSSVSN